MADNELIRGTPIRNIKLASVSSSELLQQLAQAQAERGKIVAIVESIDNGVIAIDWDGKIVLVNRACEQMTEWSRRDAIGKYYWEVFPLLDKYSNPIPLNKHPLIEAFSLDAQLQFDDIFIRSRSGKNVNISLVASPIKGVKNDIVSGIMTFRDVHKEKELERMQEDFVSMAAHELRTPIVPLKGYMEIIRDEAKLTDEQLMFLNRAYESASRLENLVNSLLSVSRIERGAIAFHPKAQNYVSLIHMVISDLEPKAAAKRQRLIFNPNDENVEVVIDTQMIREVLGNLIGNAIKYTPDEGEIVIGLNVEKGRIVTGIKDNGIGINKDDKSRLFQKFHRVGGGLTASIEGTGLGLYITKSLIERHGGNIWVESEGQGKGSLFLFSLPLQT